MCRIFLLNPSLTTHNRVWGSHFGIFYSRESHVHVRGGKQFSMHLNVQIELFTFK